MRRGSLSLKLLLSYVAVVVLSSVAAFGVARWLGPQLFDAEVQEIGQRLGWVNGEPPGSSGVSTTGSGTGSGTGPGSGSGGGQGRGPTSAAHDQVVESQQQALDEQLTAAFSGSLSAALMVALGIGLVAAFIGASIVSRRLLRPLERMSGSVRRMATGESAEPIPVPPDRELADLAADVNALSRSLTETQERRSRLVSDLSHELRTPITALDGFLEGLEDGVFEPDAETLTAMRFETRRLERLARDLGALSRASEDAFDLVIADMDIGECARDAARAMTAAFTAAGLDLQVGEMMPLPVAADRDRMAQVFTNLLRNALQHTPSGGSVALSGERVGDRVSVRVADTGSGIAAADVERVFDRFVRVGDGDGSGGAGIGLTIARGIVRAHAGELSVESGGSGAGSTFTVSLPAR
jgi:histidine kinase